MRFDRAGPGDLGELLELEQHFPGDRMSAHSVRRLLRSPSAEIWVARRERHVAAALVLLTRRGSRRARIYSLVVESRARGTGLARRLVAVAENRARVHGCTWIGLEVRSDNGPARSLYARMGYAEQARLSGYYEDGANGLRLGKALG